MKKRVVIDFKPISFTVQFPMVEGKISENGTLMECYRMKFEDIVFSEETQLAFERVKLSDADILTFADVRPGLLVEVISTKELGIITRVSNKHSEKKKISVVQSGHKITAYKPHELRKADTVNEETFKKARSIRAKFARNEDFFHEGDTGYLYSSQTNRHYPFVVGHITRGMHSIHPLVIEDGLAAEYKCTLESLRRQFKEFINGDHEDNYKASEVQN